MGIGADEDEEMEMEGGAIGGFKALGGGRSVEVSTALDLSELE